MEGGRVSHSWCMCVVVMAMVGWMGAGMELVLGRHAGQSQMVGRMSGDAGAFPECVWNTLITPDRTTVQVRYSGWGRAGIGRSSWKGLTRDATRRLRFVVHAAGWLLSMVLHGRQYKQNTACYTSLELMVMMMMI